jgi:hypothetical protein
MHKGISTPKRYIYLNTYAFLLLFAAIGVGCLPLYRLENGWYIALQVVVALMFLSYALKIFKTFKAKKKRYARLMEANAQQFVPTSFEEYMQAPCGRLLVRVVLTDLGKREAYRDLQKLKAPLKTRLHDACVPKKTIVYTAKPLEKIEL